MLEPGRPIIAPAEFDLDSALAEALNKEKQDYDLQDSIVLEGDLSDLSDLSDLEDEDDFEPLDCEPLDATASIHAPNFLNPLTPFPKALKSEGKGVDARRLRKTLRKRAKRRDDREDVREALKTTLKQVAIRRAAQSKTLCVEEDFDTESLPVSSGGWSGLRQRFDQLQPQVEELLGDEHEMQLVNWNGEYVPFFLSYL